MYANVNGTTYGPDAVTFWILFGIWAAVAVSMFFGCFFNWTLEDNGRDKGRWALLCVTAWAWPIWLVAKLCQTAKDAVQYVRSRG